MGHWISRLKSVLDEWSTTHSRIVMLGLDAAGKTTILYKFKFNESITTIPTIGFNVEEVKFKNLAFTVWDVGGQDKLRGLWGHYYANTDALIFVVDSGDRERMKEAAEELHGILADNNMQNVPVLVFANKQDLPTAVSTSQIVDELRLRQLVHRNKWHVQASNAMTGEGLYEGLETLAKMTREYRRTVRL